VLFTANDAYMRDLKIFAPADCIVSNTAADNHHALRQIATVLKGNVAASTQLTFTRGSARPDTRFPLSPHQAAVNAPRTSDPMVELARQGRVSGRMSRSGRMAALYFGFLYPVEE
jgi:hypothetical protein